MIEVPNRATIYRLAEMRQFLILDLLRICGHILKEEGFCGRRPLLYPKATKDIFKNIQIEGIPVNLIFLQKKMISFEDLLFWPYFQC